MFKKLIFLIVSFSFILTLSEQNYLFALRPPSSIITKKNLKGDQPLKNSASSNLNWEMWSREMSLDELKMIAKYKRLYNRTGIPTFTKLSDHYPENPSNLLKKMFFNKRTERPAEAMQTAIVLVFRIPPSTMIYHNLVWGSLPHRGKERLPEGYLEELARINTNLDLFYKYHEKKGKLAELGIESVDVEASIEANKLVLLGGPHAENKYVKKLFKEVNNYLEEIRKNQIEQKNSEKKLTLKEMGKIKSRLKETILNKVFQSL